jgi:DinB superfamily
MNFNTISDIYDTNALAREHLRTLLSGISDAESVVRPDGEKWSIADVVEHVSLVETAIGRICAMLLAKAEADGRTGDNAVKISDNFIGKSDEIARVKVEAPERVHPTGEKTMAESMATIDDNQRLLDEMRPLFDSLDGNEYKFPHPFFGDISAIEWLALVGGHKQRHAKQIEKILGKIRQEKKPRPRGGHSGRG